MVIYEIVNTVMEILVGILRSNLYENKIFLIKGINFLN